VGLRPAADYPWRVADSRTITRTYGRGSFLAFLSPLLAMFAARQGLDGWAQIAAQDMQRDALAMQDRGYRVVSAEEFAIPLLGITWFRVVYARPPGS
jgi:hypothetical protein